MNEKEQNQLNKQLFDATKTRDANLVSELIKAGADVNYKAHPNYGSILSFAVAHNVPEIVEILLAYGAHANDADSFSKPIFWCNNDGNGLEIAKKLLDCGADVNVISSGYETVREDDKINTPLRMHIKMSHFDIAN